MQQWQDIETAPKDGTEVDLWLIDEDGRAWRETDVRWVEAYQESFYEYAPDGSYKLSYRKRDGWWSYNHGYGGEGDFVDVPRHYNPHPRQRREIYSEATHWMPLPEPPQGRD